MCLTFQSRGYSEFTAFKVTDGVQSLLTRGKHMVHILKTLSLVCIFECFFLRDLPVQWDVCDRRTARAGEVHGESQFSESAVTKRELLQALQPGSFQVLGLKKDGLHMEPIIILSHLVQFLSHYSVQCAGETLGEMERQ